MLEASGCSDEREAVKILGGDSVRINGGPFVGIRGEFAELPRLAADALIDRNCRSAIGPW